MSNRRVLVLIAAAVAVGLGLITTLLVIQGESKDGEGKQLEIGYFSRAIGYAPYYVADELGWFEDHPALQSWSVSHTFYGDRATIADSFGTNLDVLLSAEIPAMMTKAQGADIRIVDVTGLINLSWVGLSELESEGMSDFQGRTVAYQSGTSSHYGLLKSIEDAGFQPSDFELRNMKAVEAKAAFELGQVSAWVVWSPFIEQQIVGGRGQYVPGSKYSYATTLTVTEKLLQEDPEAVAALTEILDRAQRWIAENKSQAETIVAKATLQDVEVVREALNNVDFTAELDEDVIEMFEDMVVFLVENNAIRGDQPLNVKQELLSNSLGQN